MFVVTNLLFFDSKIGIVDGGNGEFERKIADFVADRVKFRLEIG